jgi:dipeptidyl aminopeptidase/acylaminoacyl peptidase
MFKPFVRAGMRQSLVMHTLAVFSLLTLFSPLSASATDADRRLVQVEDIHSINAVGEIAISPDGNWLAYSVGTTNVEYDESSSDLYMVKWDGSARVQLTHTPRKSENHPRFSPDGKYLAFITARSDSNEKDSDEPADKSQAFRRSCGRRTARA